MRLQPPKGTKDFLPEKARKLQYLIDTVKNIFERYGFSPMYTPAFESLSLLCAKGGLGEAVKDEIYYFKDKSQRRLGLRFDLTMPLARVIAANPQLQKPFKRYCIGRVWRYDNPQALRYREFWQADVDVIGAGSLKADADCLSAACECMEALGFKKFYIRINSRKVLEELLGDIGKKFLQALRIIDKLDKIGESGVKKELKQRGIETKRIMKAIKISGSNETVLKKIGKVDGAGELQELLDYAKDFGIEKKLRIDPSLVRGLDYYTSLVYEVFSGARVSVGGGGRYDNLIGLFGRPTPATGISLGLNRILELMEEKKLFPSRKEKKFFVASASDSVRSKAIEICQQIRSIGIADMDLMDRNLAKQMEYANLQGFDYVVIVGERELKKKSVILRNMKTGKEKPVKLKDLKKTIKQIG